MEREFLAGIHFNLYVDKETYVRWVGLLEGLVMAKERGSRQWRKSRQTPRAATVARPVAPLTVPSKGNWSARARSSSPVHLPRDSGSPHSLANSNPQYSPPGISIEVESPLRSRGKRSALDAFSPTSVAFDDERPAKRPISLAVEIPQSTAAGSHTPSPLESLQSFCKLSLGSSPVPSQCAESGAVMASARHIPPQTLIASYRLDPTKPRPVPKVCIVLILVICACMLTERRCSTSSSILWRVPPWQTIADHGRVCCAITSLQSRLRLPITHTLRHHPCRLLFIRLRQALTIPVSHSHPCSPQTQRFLGLVIRQHMPYRTIPVTLAEGKYKSPYLACERR